MKFVATYTNHGHKKTSKILEAYNHEIAPRMVLFEDPFAEDIEIFPLSDNNNDEVFFNDLRALFSRLEDSSTFGSVERNLHEFSDKWAEKMEIGR